jgi:hypothetical protein
VGTVFMVSQMHYFFINCDQHKGLVTCLDSTLSSSNASPATLVKLHPGCMAKSQTHAAIAPMDIFQMVPSIITMWPDDPAKLLANIDLAYMVEIVGWMDINTFISENAAEAVA